LHFPDASLSDLITVEPAIFTLSNTQDTSTIKLTIKAFLDIITDKDGLLDSDYLLKVINMPQPQAFLKISVSAGSSYVVPVKFSFSTSDIMFLADKEYDNNSLLQDSCISELNFGSLPFGSGGSLNLIIYNPNMFKIAIWPELEGDQFSLISSSKTIGPKMFETISVTLLNKEFEDDEIAPTSQSYSGRITLTTHLDAIKPTILPLTGTLVDVTINIINY
jgi:hypothetical protein